MRTLNIKIKIDRKNNKIYVAEDQILDIPEGIDKEIYLAGIYSYLLAKHNNNLRNKTLFHIEEKENI